MTLGIDYSLNHDWGVNVQVPYIDRKHSTLGTSTDGTTPADGAYDSHTRNVGDVKIIGRYQGFTPHCNFGILYGVKLPTGSYTQTGTSTDPTNPGDPAAIDRGLQPGTGTTDAIFGAYYTDGLSQNWDYFTQAIYQRALNSRNDYKPGDGFNLNVGLRYAGITSFAPQIQLNYRHVQHDEGANADQVSTGGTLLYISPGAHCADRHTAFGVRLCSIAALSGCKRSAACAALHGVFRSAVFILKILSGMTSSNEKAILSILVIN